MKKSKLIVALLVGTFAIACKKETLPSFQSKLVNKNWKSIGFKENGISKDKWCWKNSIYNFYEDGSVFIIQGDNEGACFGSIVGTIKKYKYSITKDEKMVVINYQQNVPNEVDSFSIVSMSDTKLNLKRVVNKTAMPPGETWEDEFTTIP